MNADGESGCVLRWFVGTEMRRAVRRDETHEVDHRVDVGNDAECGFRGVRLDAGGHQRTTGTRRVVAGAIPVTGEEK